MAAFSFREQTCHRQSICVCVCVRVHGVCVCTMHVYAYAFGVWRESSDMCNVPPLQCLGGKSHVGVCEEQKEFILDAMNYMR